MISTPDRRYNPVRYFDAVETEAFGQANIVAELRARLDDLLPGPLDDVLERQALQRTQVAEALGRMRSQIWTFTRTFANRRGRPKGKVMSDKPSRWEWIVAARAILRRLHRAAGAGIAVRGAGWRAGRSPWRRSDERPGRRSGAVVRAASCSPKRRERLLAQYYSTEPMSGC